MSQHAKKGCVSVSAGVFRQLLKKEKFSDIVVLVTDRRTESEQPKMKKNCYLYTRVSTAAQIEGYSLEAQTEKLRGVCGLQGTGNSRGILRCGEIR